MECKATNYVLFAHIFQHTKPLPNYNINPTYPFLDSCCELRGTSTTFLCVRRRHTDIVHHHYHIFVPADISVAEFGGGGRGEREKEREGRREREILIEGVTKSTLQL